MDQLWLARRREYILIFKSTQMTKTLRDTLFAFSVTEKEDLIFSVVNISKSNEIKPGNKLSNPYINAADIAKWFVSIEYSVFAAVYSIQMPGEDYNTIFILLVFVTGRDVGATYPISNTLRWPQETWKLTEAKATAQGSIVRKMNILFLLPSLLKHNIYLI